MCGIWPGPGSTWSRTAPGSSSGSRSCSKTLIKISSVLSDLHGVTGRALLEALISGQRNPRVLAEPRQGPPRGLGGRVARPVHRAALAAIERSILVIIFHMLADPAVEFAELGADFYDRRVDRARQTSQLTRQLQALGYTVTLTTAA
jgi:hypothetical protein